MAIQSSGGNLGGGIGQSKAGKIGLGFLTGGPAGAAMALASSSNPKLGAAAGMAGALGGGGSPQGGNTTMPDGSVAGPSNNFGAPQLQMPQSDPMGAVNRKLAGLGYGQNNGY